MRKAEEFKKWCAERQGHPPQIKFALEAIIELQQSKEDSNASAFGDGWYDGFLEAQRLNEDESCCLEEVNKDEIMGWSERAEDKHLELTRKHIATCKENLQVESQ